MASERTEIPALKLKVTEALSRDVGRGIARLGPEDLEKLQVAIGDLVEVAGKRGTVCKVMPAHRELRGQSRIQIDGLVRENAGAGLDEFVQVRKISCRPAETCRARPGQRAAIRARPGLHRQFARRPAGAGGNRIRATLFGSRWADFRVESTTPKGPVLINPTTATGHRQPAAGRGRRVAGPLLPRKCTRSLNPCSAPTKTFATPPAPKPNACKPFITPPSPMPPDDSKRRRMPSTTPSRTNTCAGSAPVRTRQLSRPAHKS